MLTGGKTPDQQQIINAMTVDVEDYFHVSAFENHIKKNQWEGMECRIERNIGRILDLYRQHNIKATFFTLGWVAERYPALIKTISQDGHEIACHSYWHRRVSSQTQSEFAEEIIDTKKLLEDLTGQEVIGYRAPSYSIGKENLWAHEVLEKAGYRYSSSIYPISHDHYGIPDAPRFAYRPFADSDFLEIPITTSCFLNKKFPAGGGGYFRFFPYFVSRYLLSRVNLTDQQPGIFYFHPWEIDPDQPRQRNISLKTQFRHYLNLNRTEKRLVRLCGDFRWGRMDELFLSA
jgi:polysaccharide deacetylase family protein (PEP-CTERM system associated)